MKIIGENLIEGIKIGPTGQLHVDSTKINPNIIRVSENSIKKEKLELA